MIGGPFLTGTPAAIGLAESLRCAPSERGDQNSASARVDEVERNLARAWRPSRPSRQCGRDGPSSAAPPRPRPGAPPWRCPAWSPARPSPGRSRTVRRPPQAHRSRKRSRAIGSPAPCRAQPVDINRHANHPVRVVPDQVRLHQIMSDPLVLGRPAAGRGENVADDSSETVMREDHDATLYATSSRTTRPSTSVSRMSRPPWKYVKSVWSKPSRCKMVACRS